MSSGSYELLASRCNAFAVLFAVLSTTSCGSGLMEPPPSPFTFTTESTLRFNPLEADLVTVALSA